MTTTFLNKSNKNIFKDAYRGGNDGNIGNKKNVLREKREKETRG